MPATDVDGKNCERNDDGIGIMAAAAAAVAAAASSSFSSSFVVVN